MAPLPCVPVAFTFASSLLNGRATMYVMANELKYSEVTACAHCAAHVAQEIVAQWSRSWTGSDSQIPYTWSESDNYEMLLCPVCNGVSFRMYYYNDLIMEGAPDVTFQVLYPQTQSLPRGLPDRVQRSYEAALKVKRIDANAFGVLLGRVLEIVCDDRAAAGDDLYRKLEDLAKKNEIPEKLVDVAHSLRKLRNVGAHAALGELTPAEVPILEDLTRAILEYVYTAPFLATVAVSRIEQLRQARNTK
jgi:hypothetical protein